MNRVEEIIQKDIQSQSAMLSNYIKQLKSINKEDSFEFSLSAYEKKGHIYYNGTENKKTIYLGNGSDRRVKLKQLHYLLKLSIETINNNIKLEKQFLKKYRNADPNYIAELAPKAYRAGIEFLPQVAGMINIKKWANEPYERKFIHIEHLGHTAKNGTLMRSKSEVLIANALIDKGVPFRYEEKTLIGGIEVSPDFKPFIKKKNRTIIWEHAGMMSNPEYREKFLKKLELYFTNGYKPWRDLILTFDDENGNIDSLEIDNIIDSFLL